MNEPQEKIAGTNLTPIAEYTQTAMALVDLTQRYNGVVFQVDTPKGLKEAKAAAFELRTYRTDLEKMRSELKGPVLELGRLLDAEAKRITEQLRALEDPIKAQVDAREAEIDAEKIRKAQAEQARVDAHMEAIRKMREFPLSLQGKPSSVIEARIEDFTSIFVFSGCEEKFEEFKDQASDAYNAACAAAKDLLQRQREHEAEQERVRQQDAENKAMRERLAAMEREKEEAEAKIREVQEAQQRAEQARVDAIQAKIRQLAFVAPLGNASVDQIDAELKAKADPRHDYSTDYAEFHEQACDAYDKAFEHLHEFRRTAVRREHDAYEATERQAALQREMHAQAEANRVEAARLEAQRLKNLTMRDAVFAVIQWASDNGHDKEKVFRDLEAVIDNEVPEKRTAAKPARKPRTQA